jgi:hypothetical protein
MKRFLLFIDQTGFAICSPEGLLINTTLVVQNASETNNYMVWSNWLQKHPEIVGSIVSVSR